jgi:hypothetical protein
MLTNKSLCNSGESGPIGRAMSFRQTEDVLDPTAELANAEQVKQSKDMLTNRLPNRFQASLFRVDLATRGNLDQSDGQRIFAPALKNRGNFENPQLLMELPREFVLKAIPIGFLVTHKIRIPRGNERHRRGCGRAAANATLL